MGRDHNFDMPEHLNSSNVGELKHKTLRICDYICLMIYQNLLSEDVIQKRSDNSEIQEIHFQPFINNVLPKFQMFWDVNRVDW